SFESFETGNCVSMNVLVATAVIMSLLLLRCTQCIRHRAVVVGLESSAGGTAVLLAFLCSEAQALGLPPRGMHVGHRVVGQRTAHCLAPAFVASGDSMACSGVGHGEEPPALLRGQA